MTGYSRRMGGKKVTIGIANMPYRKKISLVVGKGNTVTKYATFTNDEAAYEFMDMFADFIGAERIEWFRRNKQ